MCTKSGPRQGDEPPDDEPRRRGTRHYGTPNKHPRRPGLWLLVLVLLACSSGEATPKDRKLMYDWDKPTAKQKDRYLRQPGGSRDPRGRPRRGGRGGALPNPGAKRQRPDRDTPWHWARRIATRLGLPVVS